MKRLLVSVLVALVALPALAQLPKPVLQRVEKTLAEPTFAHASVGVLVKSLDTGKVLYAKNPALALMPASNLKLVTAAAALALLGPEFQYETRVVKQGEDLVLQGSGDPSLDFARLQKLAEAVKAAGVTELRGKLLLDASCFDNRVLGDGWQWDDEPFYFSAQVAGLCCDENVALVTVKPDGTVETLPYLTVINQLKRTDGKERQVQIERRRGQNTVVVTGTLGAQAEAVKEAVTVEDPVRFTGARFVEALQQVGVRVPESLSIELGTAAPDAQPIATDRSVPLRELAKSFLKPSDNLFGECLLKTLGQQKGKGGSTDEGARVVRQWLQSRQLDLGGFHQADGSGLTRMNLVTANLLIGLLTDRAADKVYYDALPVGGVDGTLRNRFKSTPAAGVVRAKTGTLTGASSLSGYLTTKAGERLVFSILMNHYDRTGGSAAARAAQDALVLALMDLPKRR